MLRLISVLSVLFAGANTLIVPGELPTILSLVYSNIPTIKKGTDSRIGWGFRLGNRADFQVLVELGPQTNTQPLGVQQSTNSKRNTVDTLSNVLYAQRQHDKAQFSNTDGGQWLKDWSQHMNGAPKIQKPLSQTNTKHAQNTIIKAEDENAVLGIGEIDAKLVIPEDAGDKRRVPTQKIKITSTTSRAEALDNVEIDD